ncbi:MAG TPA: hypothetical protein VM865_04890 [Acidobacteriaceae bacterium]|jgi:hypothetical protein|nr:hypothetical protein [Acidobacteriaceae bacterium]
MSFRDRNRDVGGAAHPTDTPDVVPENAPDTVATPEGDNEYGFDQPLAPGTEPTPERPRGNEPHPQQPIRDALD